MVADIEAEAASRRKRTVFAPWAPAILAENPLRQPERTGT